MKTSLWVVIVVVVFFLGFLIGYSISPPSNMAPASAPVATDKAR
jgi:hypothetical protein